MEQSIRDRYHDDILYEARRRYGIAADQIRPLDAFESFIFEFERESEAFILRIGHSLRRSEALILGEVDWINHLAAAGVSVAKAIGSQTGRLVEVIDDGQGGQFLATVFVKAQGRPAWEIGWSPTLFESYGQLLGSMHVQTRNYRPALAAWQRPQWDDPFLEFVDRFLPPSESVARHKHRLVLDHLDTLPRDNTVYGLIHQDAHASNFLVDETGRITLFDFDECAYSWFANDIAIALFYTVQDAEDSLAFTHEFMTCFLQGYRRVCSLAPRWLSEIPYFLKLRELELYAVIHRDFDVNHIDNWWCERFMRDRKTRIAHDIPFIDFDFTSLTGLLE